MGRRNAGELGARPAPRHEIDPERRPGPALPRTKRFIDYPRSARRGWTRWIPSWRLILGFGTGGFVCLVLAAISLYASVDVPDPNATFNQQATFVYYSDGALMGRFAAENRTNVPLAKVPLVVRYAVLSAEDRTFYDNNGVSIPGMLRAAWNNSQGGATQGGSTITQQYVKIVLLGDQSATMQRKLKEFIIALKIGKEMDKNTILENYLNGILFGRGAWGIQAASHAYFDKDVSTLTPSEAAFLAGVLNSPNGYYEPTSGPAALARIQARWAYVADGMAAQHWITPEQRTAMKFPTKFKKINQDTTTPDDQSGYVLQMVHAEMLKLGYTEQKLYSGGLRIYTTLKRDAIAQAVQAVQTQLGPRATWPKGTQVALASIDPGTGAVVSIYAGDGVSRKQNAATQDIVQAGSTFKPFTLTAALEGGDGSGNPGTSPTGNPGTFTGATAQQGMAISLKSRFDGHSPLTIDGHVVHNFSGEQFPMVDLITATAHSINTVYVALNSQIGPKNTSLVAHRAGIPASTKIDDVLVNVLGAASPHPIDMASAYSTFAAQGIRRDWHVIAKVLNTNGPIYTYRNPGHQVFSANVMADVTYAMHAVTRTGTAGWVGDHLKQPAAGKTGTSDESKTAWFVGFTPQLSTAVALYRIDDAGLPVNLVGFKGVPTRKMTGGALPVKVWTQYMGAQLDGQKTVKLPDPQYGGTQVNPAPAPTPTPTAPTPTAPTSTTPTMPTWSTQPTGSPTRTGPTRTWPPPTLPTAIPNPQPTKKP